MASPFDPIINYIIPRMTKKYNGFYFNKDFIALILTNVTEQYKIVLSENGLDPQASAIPTSEVLKYICAYHYAYTSGQDEDTRRNIERDKSYINYLTKKLVEAIFVIENLGTSAVRIIDEKHPIYCDFNIITDYVLNIIIRTMPKITDEADKNVIRMFESAFLKAKGLVSLLAKGLEKDAMVVWRSLHEMECVLIILCKYGRPLIDLYARFDAFDKVTENMPDAVKAEFDRRTSELAINLTNPNEVDHFENYGWITAIPDMEITKRNLNFKFIQELAGQGDRYVDYQAACDALHMNSKVLKWNKLSVFDFDIKSCFNSVNRLIESFDLFIRALGFSPVIDRRMIQYRENLKFSIDAFLNGNKF